MEIWLVKTLRVAVVYFKLLQRFDEGWMFWTLLVAGIGIVYDRGYVSEFAWPARRSGECRMIHFQCPIAAPFEVDESWPGGRRGARNAGDG